MRNACIAVCMILYALKGYIPPPSLSTWSAAVAVVGMSLQEDVCFIL